MPEPLNILESTSHQVSPGLDSLVSVAVVLYFELFYLNNITLNKYLCILDHAVKAQCNWVVQHLGFGLVITATARVTGFSLEFNKGN